MPASRRLPPLSSMWEAQSDLDYDALNGNAEADTRRREELRAWTKSVAALPEAAGSLAYGGGHCTPAEPLPAGYRYCATCDQPCKPDPDLDPTSCTWCAYTARRAGR